MELKIGQVINLNGEYHIVRAITTYEHPDTLVDIRTESVGDYLTESNEHYRSMARHLRNLELEFIQNNLRK